MANANAAVEGFDGWLAISKGGSVIVHYATVVIALTEGEPVFGRYLFKVPFHPWKVETIELVGMCGAQYCCKHLG